MILRELELENFRCFKDQTFEFPNGLVGILGPNGSGKSTILEAIAWVLYGSSSLRTTRDELVYDEAEDGSTCRAKLKFRFDQTSYEVERKMTGSSLTAQGYIKPVNEDPLAEGFQGITEYVQGQLLRMNEDAFFKSVFSKQNEVRELSRGGPEERRQLFAKLLDIERIKESRRYADADARKMDTRAEALRDKLGDLESLEEEHEEKKEQRSELSETVSDLKERLEDTKEAIAETAEEFKKLEAEKEELNELEKEKTELDTTVESQKESLRERTEELKELREKKVRAEELEDRAEEYEEARERRKELEEQKDRFHEREKLQSQKDQIRENREDEEDTLEELHDRLENYDNPSRTLEDKKSERDELKERIGDLRDEMGQIDGTIRNKEDAIEDVRENLTTIEEEGDKGVCPVCERTLEDDFSRVTDHFHEEIEELEDGIDQLEERQAELRQEREKLEEKRAELDRDVDDLEQRERQRRQLQEKINDLSERIENLKEKEKRTAGKLAELGEVEFDREEYGEVKETLEEREDDYERYQRLIREAERIPNIEQRIEKIEQKLDAKKCKLLDIKKEIENYYFDEERYRTLREELETLRSEKDDLQEQFSEKDKKLTQLETQIDHLDEKIETEKKAREELEELRDDQAQLKRVSGFFDEFREDLLTRIRPILSRKASNLLERTTDGRYRQIEIDPEYRVRVYDNGIPYPLDRFSGGETDLANLCLRIAISELVSNRSGKPINFIVLDEVFGSQDQQRRRNILQALRQLDDLFAQIFLITHAEDIKDRLESVMLLSRHERGTTDVEMLI